MKTITKNLLVCACTLFAISTLFGMQPEDAAHDEGVETARELFQQMEQRFLKSELRGAIVANSGDRIERLVEQGAGALVSGQGWPLVTSAYLGRLSALQALYRCGADVSAVCSDHSGNRPLQAVVTAPVLLRVQGPGHGRNELYRGARELVWLGPSMDC